MGVIMFAEKENKSTTCPECGVEIDVNTLIYHQIEEDLSKQFNSKLAEERKKNEQKANDLLLEKKNLEADRASIASQIQDGITLQVRVEKKKIETQLRKSLEEETSDQIKSLNDELEKKSEQVKELNKVKADITKLQREKNELREAIEAEAQAKIDDIVKAEKQKIQKASDDRNQLKISEREAVIDQLKNQLQEAHRKAEQGSMQLQGEVQEIAIEEWLKNAFPLDEISEIKKGARGADCLHIVNTRTRQNCGSIYYESKRTKEFQPTWIEKFKEDMRAKSADIGVIVTEAMPKGMERMGQKDGIWICSFDEFKGLCTVLRESIVQISNVSLAQENKGEKMNMLYSFLTSNEFRLQVEAIVEGFTQMQTDLTSERRAMESAWKKREKQIDKVLLNTTHMYSSIKGIAGSAIASISQLELKHHND